MFYKLCLLDVKQKFFCVVISIFSKVWHVHHWWVHIFILDGVQQGVGFIIFRTA